MSSSLPVFTVVAALAAGLLGACAHHPKQIDKIYRDTTVGEQIAPGPVRATAYAARVSMEHNIAHISVLQSSQCPVIKMRVVHRIEETSVEGKVVERSDQGTHEISEPQSTVMQCEARYARVPLELQYGSEVYPLGQTSEYGTLDVDLASAMKVNTRAVDLSTKTAWVRVSGTPLVEIDMAGLLKQQQRLDAIITHLGALLGKSATALTDADVTNASMLYQEMRELAPDDARTIALQSRFVQVLGGFQGVQQTASLKRNLSALAEAKELLAAPGAMAAVPLYVQASLTQDNPSDAAIAWARAQLLVALRTQPTLCAGGFDPARLAAATGTTRIASSLLRYAFDGSEAQWYTTLCTH